jgi:hypothetical protein
MPTSGVGAFGMASGDISVMWRSAAAALRTGFVDWHP